MRGWASVGGLFLCLGGAARGPLRLRTALPHVGKVSNANRTLRVVLDAFNGILSSRCSNKSLEVFFLWVELWFFGVRPRLS